MDQQHVNKTIQENWENYHKSNFFNVNYPFDDVLRFYFRYKSQLSSIKDIRVLDLGCGSGNNIEFIAQDGAFIEGVDVSGNAIEKAQKKLSRYHEKVTLTCSSFEDLTLKPNTLDLVFDRKSLTCVSKATARATIEKVIQGLKVGGYFMFTPLADEDQRYIQALKEGNVSKDDLVLKLNNGNLKNNLNFRGYSFYSFSELTKLLNRVDVQIVEFKKQITMDILESQNSVGWEIIIRKTENH